MGLDSVCVEIAAVFFGGVTLMVGEIWLNESLREKLRRTWSTT